VRVGTPMPRIWLWIREHVYTELERIASQEGKDVNDVIKKLIEAYIKGELILKSKTEEEVNDRLEKLEKRVELLEEMLRYLLSTRR